MRISLPENPADGWLKAALVVIALAASIAAFMLVSLLILQAPWETTLAVPLAFAGFGLALAGLCLLMGLGLRLMETDFQKACRQLKKQGYHPVSDHGQKGLTYVIKDDGGVWAFAKQEPRDNQS